MMINHSPTKAHDVSLTKNNLQLLPIINVPSGLWFLCLTQIAEDGRGPTDRINGSSAKSLLRKYVREIYEQI